VKRPRGEHEPVLALANEDASRSRPSEPHRGQRRPCGPAPMRWRTSSRSPHRLHLYS